MKHKQILLADDDEGIRKVVSAGLRIAGYITLTAADGAAALSTCRQHPVDLAIIDLLMPKKEGIETIVELRRMQPSLAIVAISGGGCAAAHDYLRMALMLGATRTLAKPFCLQELLVTVTSLLEPKAHPAVSLC